MHTSTQIRCQTGTGSRMCITRAQQGRSGGMHAAALGLPLLVVQNALASVPSLDDLQALSYDSSLTPKAVKAVSEATDAASKLDAVSAQDATPLIAGLAVGIALVGGAIAYFSQPGGPRIQVACTARLRRVTQPLPMRIPPVLDALAAAKPASADAASASLMGDAALSCQGALKLLEENPEAQLIDIRPKEDLRETGSPDLRSVKKSPINVAYKPMVQASTSGTQQSTITIGWAERLCRNSKTQVKVGQELPVILLDTNGRAAGAAAKELATASPERPVLYTIAGGAEAWLAQELPWKEPLKLGINLDTIKAIDISGVAEGTEKLVEKYKENPTIVNGSIAAVAVAGASLFLFTEVEAILQVVGVVVALQFLGKRLLFAEDRQQTFNDLKMLITDKIAAGQAGEDLKRLAERVLDAGSAEGVTERAAASAAPVTAAAPAAPAAGGSADSVAEAAEWIEGWRRRQAKEGGAGMNGSTGAEEMPENVAEAQEWIKKFQKDQV